MLHFRVAERIIILTIAWLLAPATSFATDPTTREALHDRTIKLAPVINDTFNQSYDISGWIAPGPLQAWQFRIAHRAPDLHSIRLWHKRDGTPAVICSGDRVLMYDALQSRILFVRAGNVGFRLRIANEKWDFEWGVNRISDPTRPVRYDVILDVASLLVPLEPLKIEELDRGHFLVFGVTKRGNPGAALVDPAAKTPFRRVELGSAEGERVWLSLEPISVGEPVPDNAFAFPDLDRIRAKMPVIEREPKDEQSRQELSIELTIAQVGRLALDNPEMRPKVEALLGKIDWEAVRQKDAAISPLVREFLGTPPKLSSGPASILESKAKP